MCPIWERTFSGIPERTQLLLWRSSDTWYAMLAVCEGNIRADLGGFRRTVAVAGVHQRDGLHPAGWDAGSDDPYRAIHECVRAAVTRTHIRMRS